MAGSESEPSAPSNEQRRISLALLLLAGLLVTIVGESISAAGAPEVGVVDTWGRIDEAVSQIADWPLLLLTVIAALTLLSFRGTPIDHHHSTGARVAWTGAVGALAVLAVSSVVGMVALSERVADAGAVGGVGSIGYYSETEKIGESVAYAAILLVAIGVGVLVVRSLRTSQAPSDS